MTRGYTLQTYANGFGLWHCKIAFDFPGVGNTYEAECLKYQALDAAKRAIRREIVVRQAQPCKRLAYHIVENRLDSLNRLHSLTVAEL
jgi:hypothetical protein